jgi:hypothetical protein
MTIDPRGASPLVLDEMAAVGVTGSPLDGTVAIDAPAASLPLQQPPAARPRHGDDREDRIGHFDRAVTAAAGGSEADPIDGSGRDSGDREMSQNRERREPQSAPVEPSARRVQDESPQLLLVGVQPRAIAADQAEAWIEAALRGLNALGLAHNARHGPIDPAPHPSGTCRYACFTPSTEPIR